MPMLKNIVTIYKKYSKYPYLNCAKFISNNDPILVTSMWNINDLVVSKSKPVCINYQIDKTGRNISKCCPIMTDEEIIIDIYSRSFEYRAICFEKNNQSELPMKDGKTNTIHIWRDNLFIKSINLSEFDKHGAIIKKNFNFGNFQWLRDGESIIYVAESKKPKKRSYFQHVPSESQSQQSAEVGNQFKYRRDFGEQLATVDSPVVCVLNVVDETVEVLDSATLCPDLVIGTVSPHPHGLGFVFSGYNDSPYTLGLIYCTQRRCDLFYYEFESKTVTKIGNDNKSKMQPVFSPDGEQIIWLENDARGPHMQCQRLMKYCLIDDTVETVIDIVEDPGTGFPGIYSLGLIDNCWTSDGNYILLNSQNRCQNKIILIDIKTGDVTTFDDSKTMNSETLLDFNNQFILAKISSPSELPYLAVADFQMAKEKKQMNFIPLSSVHTLFDILDYQILEHEPNFCHPKYGKKKFQSIFVSSKKTESRPLILMLHGGPHSAFNSEFSIFNAAVAELGFSVLMVNYRGSWGFGQQSIDSLLGHIGEMDVDDCIKACEDTLAKFPSKVSPEDIFLYGGSHGGFLAAHLAAKYSKRVKAMACRNPVINIPAMVTTTDIPDWNYTESGFEWNFDNILTNEQIIAMWEKSPLKSVDKINCPVLIMIGMEDKRVPPSQGAELYKALLARSKVTELFVYPKDSHPLVSVEATSDGFVNILSWFTRHAKL